MAATAALIAELRASLGTDAVLDDAVSLHAYGRDRTRLLVPAPCAVALPTDRDGVVAVVRACARHGVAIVPSGGRTGLAGGAIAGRGELVLSLTRMAAVGPIDPVGQTVRAEAGATNAAVQAAAAPHGLHWPVDLAAKGSATIGGNLATNAGGVRVIRYGHTRHWVLGVEAVMADGAVIDVGGALHKDNTGLDLRGLLIGSEGTLGIITAATLALAPLPAASEVALLALDDLPAALAALALARRLPGVLSAFEVVSAPCVAAVRAHGRLPAPFAEPAPWLALVEVEAYPGAYPGDSAALVDAFAAFAALPGVRDVVVATDAAQRRALWRYREDVSESLAGRWPHKNDVAVPIAALPAFVDALLAWVEAQQGAEVALFGHVGDGNLHVNTLCPPGVEPERFQNGAYARDRELFALVRRFGGSISAEHGIGLLKVDHLGLQRSPAEIALMRAVKAALDPQGLLNPGKVLPEP